MATSSSATAKAGARKKSPSKRRGKPTSASIASRHVELMPLFIIGVLALFAMSMWVWRGQSLPMPSLTIVAPGAASNAETPPDPPPLPFSVPKLPAHAVHNSWTEANGKAVLVRPDDTKLTLTLDPARQTAIDALLAKHRNAHAAVVIIDAATGAVRVFSEHTSTKDPAGARHSPASARQPAASVFKIVTSAALLEAGVQTSDTTCFHGGVSGIKKWHLKARPEFDKRCETLTQALANSSNVVFARRSLQHLQTGALAAKATDFLFGTSLGFDVQGRDSRFTEGTGDLRRGRAAAGFVGAKMSVLHGAVIGAALANKGVAMRPYIVQSDSAQPGHEREPSELQAVVSEPHAAALMQMLSTTTTDGTGRRAFKKWPTDLAHIGVAGKTGSLSGRGKPWRHYSWFVGAAPAARPEIGFAVLAVNGKRGRAKAADIARDAMALWFADRKVRDDDSELASTK